jgi:hypothetical protein
VSHLDLVTDLYTSAAPDALVRIVLKSKVFSRVIAGRFRIDRRAEHVLAELIFIRISLEIALPVFVTGCASTFMLAKKQFENRLANRPNLIRIGSYNKAVPGFGCAGGLQTSPALDLNKAHSAGTGRRQSWIVTEIRNLDAVGKSGLKYRLPCRRIDLSAVYR